MLQRHATDVVSLVFGTIFAGFTAIWLLTATSVIDEDDAWLGGPVILIVAGIVGLATAFRPRTPSPAYNPAYGAAPDAAETTVDDGADDQVS